MRFLRELAPDVAVTAVASSLQARYAHITWGMSGRLGNGLTQLRTAALVARREFAPGSPVEVLDRLLGEK